MQYLEITKNSYNFQIKQKKTFKAKDQNEKIYEIEMGICDNYIIFRAEINNGIITKKYFDNCPFEKLKRINIFNFYNKIEEIYEQLETYIQDKGISLLVNKNNIILTISTNINIYPNIIFELKQENIDNNQIINVLMEKVSNLESENKKLKEDMENMKQTLTILNENISFLVSENNDIKKSFNQINVQNNIINIFQDSSIVEPKESYMICNWINPNLTIKAKLLYRVSDQGDDPKIFHSFCDNRGPIIFFIKINNGYRFGAFTSLSWTSNNKPIKDKNAFLFSLNNKLKFENTGGNTVYHAKDIGPIFGDYFFGNFGYKGEHDFDLVIQPNHCLNGKHNYCDSQCGSYTFSNKQLVGEKFEGKFYFDIINYEVYSIQL